jgi:hypothetical protein
LQLFELFVCLLLCLCLSYCNEDFTETLRLQYCFVLQSADGTVGVRVVWNVRLCCWVSEFRRFKVTASYRNVVHLKTKISRCFETSGYTDQSTLRYIQQDINPYQHHHYQHYEQNVPVCSNDMFSVKMLIVLQYICCLQLEQLP